jgi:hypothetical protein
MTYLHISISALEDCINSDSYGEICVHCNACGRFDKSTQKECAIKMYKRQLQEQYNFNGWIEMQKRNIESNIQYYKKKIAELEVKNE